MTIDTGYANGGVIVRDGLIIFTCPIYQWMVGKPWDQVKTWGKIKWYYEHASQNIH